MKAKIRIATHVVFLFTLWGRTPLAAAAEYHAGPSDYRTILPDLLPGDVLNLEGGLYTTRLNVRDLNGTPEAWITIRGPETGEPAVFLADPVPCCNTVEIRDSSYVSIENLVIDGDMRAGAFGVSAKDGLSNRVHHIRIQGCTFINHDNGQSTVAISTKTPTWGWIIRRNRILGAGTGLYLGSPDGTNPFVRGIIEENLVVDTLGYNMQIKFQGPRPEVAGLPAGPSSTIIRHNVFIKTDRESPAGNRPNVLVGGFPETGAGSGDSYQIYGNLFYHNPRESLLQASGRVSIHDNVFVSGGHAAMALQNHDLPLRMARVYNNTIYGVATGIRVSGTMDQGVHVIGNLVFAQTGLSGTPTAETDNIFAPVQEAQQYVSQPSLVLGEMDFYPLPDACEGPALDLSGFSTDLDHDRDFNAQPKAYFTFRGAYAGSGMNPGWVLDEDIKSLIGSPEDPDPEDPDPEDPDPEDPENPGSSSGGCSCSNAGHPPAPQLLFWFLLLALYIRRKDLTPPPFS